LVGPPADFRAVTDDPIEFHHGEEVVIVGCSRLECVTCRQSVRVEPDPLPAGQTWRSYECACLQYREENVRAAEEDDDVHPWLPWKCAGHRVTELPTRLDGVELGRDTDLLGLIRESLAGWSPREARSGERKHAVGWVIKLYVRLLGTGLEEVASRATAALLTDDDARVRSAALAFFEKFHEVTGADRIDELVRGDRSLFAGPDSIHPKLPMENTLLRVLGNRAAALDEHGRPQNPAALELAKEEALRPGRGAVIYSHLATADEAWFVQNAEAIARANPGEWYNLMIAVTRNRVSSPSVAEVAITISRVPGVDLAGLRKFADYGTRDPAKGMILAAIGAGPGGAPR
jgi:hypothetical protein